MLPGYCLLNFSTIIDLTVKAGAEAFKSHDFQSAELALNQAKAIRADRKKLTVLENRCRLLFPPQTQDSGDLACLSTELETLDSRAQAILIVEQSLDSLVGNLIFSGRRAFELLDFTGVKSHCYWAERVHEFRKDWTSLVGAY